MNEEIKYRLFGLEGIVYRLHQNLGLVEYITYGLHREPFNLSNNFGLYWTCGRIVDYLIIDFYKVIAPAERFSFAKITNISRDLRIKVNYALIEEKTKKLRTKYDGTDFETVRSKYLAHQDLRVPQMRGDIRTIRSLTEDILKLFKTFSKEFGSKRPKFSNEVADSFGEIFTTIDEYERVKGFLLWAKIEGHDTVKISKLAKIMNNK